MIGLSEVYAVVVETTGNISVRHGTSAKLVNPLLLQGVEGGADALQRVGLMRSR